VVLNAIDLLISGSRSFTTDAFASILSSARKFAAHFRLANQYINQGVPPRTAGSPIVSCVAVADAELLALELLCRELVR